MVTQNTSRIVREFYTDFYGCRYRITHDLRNDLCLLDGWTDRGNRSISRKYQSYRGARVALGKYTEGTARKEEQ